MNAKYWTGSVGVGLLFTISGHVLAGDGTFEEAAEHSPANPRFVVKAKLYQDLPRTSEEQEALFEQLQGASEQLCDTGKGLSN